MTPIGGKSITETSIDTDSDHVSSYGDIKSFGACQCIIIVVVVYLIVLIMEEEEEVVGKQFNSFEGLESLASVGCAKSI